MRPLFVERNQRTTNQFITHDAMRVVRASLAFDSRALAGVVNKPALLDLPLSLERGGRG